VILFGALAAAAAVISGGCAGDGGSPGARVEVLSPAAFQAAIDESDRVTINVHTPDEGSIRGTDLAIPFDELAARQRELPIRSTPLAVYCRSGSMSADAVDTLIGLGFQDIVELEGGMLAWGQDRRPIVPVTTG
jgi:rhodanese-related sulfurtransferase